MVGISCPNTILRCRSLGSRRDRAEFMFPPSQFAGRGWGRCPPLVSPSESPRPHKAVGTRRGLMPVLGGRAGGGSRCGSEGRPRCPALGGPPSPPGDPPRVLGAAGSPSRGRRRPQRAQCVAQGPPCSAGIGSPQDGREEPDPAPAGAAPQRQGGSQGSPAGPRCPAAGAGLPAGVYAPG